MAIPGPPKSSDPSTQAAAASTPYGLGTDPAAWTYNGSVPESPQPKPHPPLPLYLWQGLYSATPGHSAYLGHTEISFYLYPSFAGDDLIDLNIDKDTFSLSLSRKLPLASRPLRSPTSIL